MRTMNGRGEDEAKPEDTPLIDFSNQLTENQTSDNCLKKKSLREHEEEIELLGKFEKSSPPVVLRKEIQDFFGYDPFVEFDVGFVEYDGDYPVYNAALDDVRKKKYLEARVSYYKQLYESEGFDLDNYVKDSFLGPVRPFTEFRNVALEYDCILHLSERAITLYNKQNDTSYELVDVVKVNSAVLLYFITFTATDGSRDLEFQTRAEGTFYNICDRVRDLHMRYDVLFCRLKPKKKMPEESGDTICEQ